MRIGSMAWDASNAWFLPPSEHKQKSWFDGRLRVRSESQLLSALRTVSLLFVLHAFCLSVVCRVFLRSTLNCHWKKLPSNVIKLVFGKRRSSS